MSFRHVAARWLLGLALTLGVAAQAAELPPVKGTRAVFAISPTVVVADPPRFGANIIPTGMSHWDTEPWHNQWWLAPNPNPVTTRLKGTASGGSETTLEDEGKGGNGPRIGFWDVFRDGYFDGGKVVVYRFADGKISLVREGQIASYQASKGGPNKLTFTTPGPAVQAGDEYVLGVVRTSFPANVTRTWGENPWWLMSGLTLPQAQEKALVAAGVRTALVADAPLGGGGASFALTLPAGWSGGRVSVGYWLHSGERPDWPRLHTGKTYTVRLWLKQTGMATGAVDVQIGSLGRATFKATDKWQEFTTDFVGAPPTSRGAERFDIGTQEAGTLYLDNITIVEKDGPPAGAFYPVIVDTLKRFHPSTLRLWPLQENRGFGRALDDGLGEPASANLTFHEIYGAGTTTPVGLHQQLVLCEQVGADPWIVASTLFTPQEWQQLIEYLAGPASSPYGKKRADWGHPQPWTASFKRIKIEIGNETWNPMFVPQGFGGRGAVYGAYSEFMIHQMQASPWFKAEQFQFVINGWVAQTRNDTWGFGASALRNAPSAQAIDIAYYTGGWDAVGLLQADSPQEGWMNILTFSRRMLVPRAREFKATADAIASAQGRPGAVQPLVYEAGPGYTLPAPGKFNMKEQEEGKSLAQAINSLDSFMSNLRDGYGDQAFFIFKNGHYWSSHNRQWGEHIAWKALGMRNALLQGDLITATASEMVTLDLPESKADVISQSNSADHRVATFPPVPNMPLVDCYPFRAGKHYSTMLLSRRLDGPTTVTLKLPYVPRSAYTLHLLTGDRPDVHNIEAEVVKVKTTAHEGMTQEFTYTLPPYSVVVLETDAQ